MLHRLMERGNGNEVVGQDRGSHCADWRRPTIDAAMPLWLDFAAKEMHAHHRCTSYGIYACFLGAKMEVQENLIRGTTWK